MLGINRVARLALSTSIAVVLSAAAPAAAISISCLGDWTLSLGALDLAAGAGSDLIAVHESAPDQGVISIEQAAGPWRVDVKKTDSFWTGSLALSVRRTSDGSGPGSISGGSSYLELGSFDTTLFSGSLDRSSIEVQTSISGVSVGLGAETFSTTITYTVVDE